MPACNKESAGDYLRQLINYPFLLVIKINNQVDCSRKCQKKSAKVYINVGVNVRKHYMRLENSDRSVRMQLEASSSK